MGNPENSKSPKVDLFNKVFPEQADKVEKKEVEETGNDKLSPKVDLFNKVFPEQADKVEKKEVEATRNDKLSPKVDLFNKVFPLEANEEIDEGDLEKKEIKEQE